MSKEILPLSFPQQTAKIYAGFGSRLAARFIDFIIVAPVVFGLYYLGGLSKELYYWSIVPSIAFGMFYEIFLVKKYGATPGKLVMDLRILNANGDPVAYCNAFFRYVVSLGISLFSIAVTCYVLTKLSDEQYASLTFLTRSKVLSELSPVLMQLSGWLNTVWVLILFIVLLVDRRRRTIHDYIGNTVVVKKGQLYVIDLYKEENASNE